MKSSLNIGYLIILGLLFAGAILNSCTSNKKAKVEVKKAVPVETGPPVQAYTIRSKYQFDSSAKKLQGPPTDHKWKLVWNDEFEGQQVDSTKWQNPSGFQRYNELPGVRSYSTNFVADNCYLNGEGKLVIKCTRDADGTIYFHNGLTSYFSKTYGYFEARVKFTYQPGWWSAFWLSGVPYNEGDDPFLYPQEFDIHEDFYKPKKQFDIQQGYWANSGQPSGNKILAMKDAMKIHKVLDCVTVNMCDSSTYRDWHTVALEWNPFEYKMYIDRQQTLRMSYNEVPVTTVPQKIAITSQYGSPREGITSEPFYGWFTNTMKSDSFMVDFVRVYEEDFGNKTAPLANVQSIGPASSKTGQTIRFKVTAKDADGLVKKLILFSKGRVRAELAVNAPFVSHVFEINNLFEGDNTLVLMAVDNDGMVGVSDVLIVKVTGN